MKSTTSTASNTPQCIKRQNTCQGASHVNTLFIIILSFAAFFSCDKEEELQPFEFKTATMEYTLSDVVFALENAGEEFVTMKWSPVDFGPSKTVKYSVEIAMAGTSFAKPVDVSTTTQLSDTLTVGELNLALAQLGAKVGEETSVDIRVRAWVNYIEAPAVTETISVTVVPYLVVFPSLYAIGDGTSAGWAFDNPIELVSYSPGIYEGEGGFVRNGNFRFFYELDWAAEQVRATDFTGGTLDEEIEPVGDGDGNFRFIGLSGNYKIRIDRNTSTITIDPAGPPPPPASLFFVTSNAIDLEAEAIEFPAIDPGVYENTIIIPQNTKFRFFTELNWNKEKWGWSYFEEDSIDSDLGNSGDDVSNFIFLSDESEYYKITISAENKSIKVVPSDPPFPQELYLNGDAQNDFGPWNFDNPAILLSVGPGVYEGMAEFEDDGLFRFFGTDDWVEPQWGNEDFTNVPGIFSVAGDNNFRYNGDHRYYKITVSLVDKTITVEDPVLFLIGSDQGNWDLGSAFALTWQSAGTFTGTTTFTNGSTFRFFITPSWIQMGNQFNFNAFTTVDSDLPNAGDGDQNFLFNGTTGSHTITVDLINSSVEIN